MPSHLFVDATALNDSLTKEILATHSDVSWRLIDNLNEIDNLQIDPKQAIFLTRQRGSLVKACPGIVPGNLCCRYQVINQTLNCPLQCSYCILQDYLNQPATIIYTDIEGIFAEIEQILTNHPQRFFRFGTGELGDSLALSGSRLFARRLVTRFADYPNALIELKTKTTHIQEFLPLRHNGHTVLAWSLNAPVITRHEEKGTASLTQRLAAARQAQEAGYLLAFHFDPLIVFPGAEVAYTEVAKQLFSTIDARRIVWISLGALRFPPPMENRIRQRYPTTQLLPAEMVKGLDGKLRYFRPLRVNLMRTLYRQIKALAPEVFVYLCMETPLVWKEVTGFVPQDNADLDYLFASSISQRFPHLTAVSPQKHYYSAEEP